MAGTIGFDRVELTDNKSGEIIQLNRAQYERLPLRDRVRMLMDGAIRFYLRDIEISARDALKG